MNARIALAIVAVALFALTAPAEAQTPSFRQGSGLQLLWDCNADETDVSRYEVQIDNRARVTVNAIGGQCEYSYQIPVALLSVGSHVAKVRACSGEPSASICSADVALAFSVTHAHRPPMNPRVLPIPEPITLNEAVEVAQAYAVLARGRRLDSDELQYLAVRYVGPAEKGALIAFLDAEWTRLTAQ